MSRTIDERIVQMTFNNQDFEKKANETISTLSRLGEGLKLTGGTDGLTSVGKAADKLNLSNVTEAVYKLRDSFKPLEEIAVGAFRKIGAAVGDVVLKTTQMVDSLMGVGMLSKGFEKYNDLNSSVQTLVNSTGKSVDEIDKYLEELMWYSDETSFGFTDMTKALGTMTASGGDIEKLIPMIMGIGNATAFAGKGAAEFQRVIYNLNQSYGAGYLSLMDWKSVENAGASSKQLKEVLIQTAEEIGTIKKGTMTIGNFSEMLKKKVITSEVMEKGFNKFAEMTLKAKELVDEGAYATTAEAIEALSGQFENFAERAFKSAQEAKSFAEALDATKDAVSSGWMQTFKLIFGNYEESKALWTDVTNTMWDVFASGAEGRNNLLKSWKDMWKDAYNTELPDINSALDFERWKENSQYLTQTQALFAAISNVILAIKDNISNIWNSMFPMHTMLDKDGNIVTNYKVVAQQIYIIIEKIRSALNYISTEGMDSKVAVAIRNDLRALLNVLITIVDYAKAFNEAFIKPLINKLKPVLGEIADIFNNLGNIIFRTASKARENIKPFESFLSNVLDLLDPIINLIKDALHWINEMLSSTDRLPLFEGVFKTIGNAVEFAANVIKGSIPLFQTIGDIIAKTFNKAKDAIKGFLSTEGIDLTAMAEGGFLAYLAVGLTQIIKKFKDMDISELKKGFGASIATSIKNVFDSLSEGISNFFDGKNKIEMIKELSNALIKLAIAMAIISLVDPNKIASSLGGLMGAIGEVLATMAIISKMDIGNQAVKAFSKLSTALLVLSIALKIMSTIDPLAMTTTVIGLGVVLTELAIFMSIMASFSKSTDNTDFSGIGRALTLIGFGMIEIAAALAIMSLINPEKMGEALKAFGISLGLITAALLIVAKFTNEDASVKMLAFGASLVGVGFALIEIAAALNLMAMIPANKLDTALTALFASLGIIALISIAISKFAGAASFVAVSAGMLIMASAIAILTVSMIALSAVDTASLFEALGFLVALMASVGVLGTLLGLVSGPFLAFSVALLAFGSALLVVSKAMAAAVVSFGAFQLIAGDFAKAFGKVVAEATAAIITLIPAMIAGIAEGIINSAAVIIQAIWSLIEAAMAAIEEALPRILEFITNVVISIASALIPLVQELVPILIEFINALIEEFFKGLSSMIVTFVAGLLEFLVNTINGLAEAIRENGPALGEAIGNLAAAILEALIGGLIIGVVTFADKIAEFGKTFLGSIKEFFDGNSSSKENEKSGEKVNDDIIKGMENSKKKVKDKARTIGEEIVLANREGMDNKKQDAWDKAEEIMVVAAEEKMNQADLARESGRNTLKGLIEGLQDEDLLAEIYACGVAAAEMFNKGYNETLVIHSPSRVMMQAAKYTLQGLIVGLEDTTGLISAGERVGNTLFDAISYAMDQANSVLQEDLNPVITPVLDLSNIEANSGYISSLLGTNASYQAALAVKSPQLASNIQNGAIARDVNINVDFTIDNAGGDITELDMSRFGKIIADEVNVRLGKLFGGL